MGDVYNNGRVSTSKLRIIVIYTSPGWWYGGMGYAIGMGTGWGRNLFREVSYLNV